MRGETRLNLFRIEYDDEEGEVKELTLEDVEQTIYPHPAVAESIREACLSALGRAIHA